MTILRERVQRELCLRADNRSDPSGAHERLHAADTNTAGSSHRGKQFCTANSVRHYRITRALVLWNFFPGSASRTRPECHFDRLGEAEAE
jgi:hypothetical protein